MSAPVEMLRNLGQARNICLHDPAVYVQVVPGVLGVIGAAAPLALRRWGAEFLAETFASPALAAEDKQKLSLQVLDTLRGYLERQQEAGADEDATVVKVAVQCAASIYPFVFRHTIANPSDDATWATMTAIKMSILKRMETAPAGVRICCVKFVACVVQVQTPGVITEPRRPELNEISLALVPRDHPVIPPSNLEAEASGLLDRLLGALQDNDTDALLVTATLNSLSALVTRRASVSTKILLAMLNFNPLTLAHGQPLKGRDRVAVKSMTRTTMSFLLNVLKRNQTHQLASRLQRRIEQLRYGLAEIFSESGPGKRKPEPVEPTDGFDDAKRRRIDQETAHGTAPQPEPAYSPLPPGPVSVAQLFMLSNDPSAAGFHVELIPQHIVAALMTPLLQSIDQKRYEDAINAVRSRYLELERRPPPTVATLGDVDDDDYDPSMGFADPGQIDEVPLQGVEQDVAVGMVRLETAPPLTEEERDEYSRLAVKRVRETLDAFDRDLPKDKGGRKLNDTRGFQRLAAVGYDRDGWITLLTRLATRAPFELDDEGGGVKNENDDLTVTKKGLHYDLADGLRRELEEYILDDWRRRLDIAIAWLNEEWYSDCLAYQSRHQSAASATNGTANGTAHGAPLYSTLLRPTAASDLPNYTRFSLRILADLVIYLDAKESRYLIRFLSEIPHLSRAHLDHVKKISEDPERVSVATQALLYLVMLRPPVRNIALDVAEEIWRENVEARPAVGKVLGRWRPQVLKEEAAASPAPAPAVKTEQ